MQANRKYWSKKSSCCNYWLAYSYFTWSNSRSVGEEVLDVYIGNLSNRVGVDDLRELFDGVSGQKSMVSVLASVLAKKILANFGNTPPKTEPQFFVVNDAQGRFMRYCRVSGYSRAAATRLITQLAGLNLHGQMLEVRPFYPRALANDPRRAGWHFRRWLGAESRMADRRIAK